MQIFVKTLTGAQKAYNVEPTQTVLEVKQVCVRSSVQLMSTLNLLISQILQEKEGVEVAQIRLVYKGKQLADTESLQDAKVDAGQTIHMVLQLRGGC